MSISKKYILRGASKLLFDLIIVFCGVFLAFIVSDWNTRSAKKQRFEKTIKVLQSEISDFITYSPIPIRAMEDSLQQYRVRYSLSQKPPPPYYREPRASGAPTAAWEALLSSGAYDIMEPILFYEMTIYYNRVISINVKFNRYMVRIEEQILPRLHGDRTFFYNGRTLKSEYRFHIQMLEEIITELKQLRIDAEALKNNLEKQFPTRK